MTRADLAGRGVAGLLAPSAITIVGASPDSFFASALLDNLTSSEFPFRGELTLVSRSRSEVNGIPCVASLADVESPGLIYLLVGAAQCLPVLEQVRRPIDGVVVITSDLGSEREARLAAWAAQRDVPLLGPNCMGLLNLTAGFFGYAGPLMNLRRGRIGLVMQSGGMLSGVVGALASRGLGVSSAISFGNAVSLDFLDLAVPLLDNDDIDTLLVYSESIRDVRDLRTLGAEATARGKNIVLVQGGQSEAGAIAAQSHTGSLATPARIVEGVARQAGILACADLEQAVWALEALSTPGLPERRDGGVAVLSTSGGGAVAMADAADGLGVVLEGDANPVDVGAAIMDRPETLDAFVEEYSRDYSVIVHVAGVGLPNKELPRHAAVARRLAETALSRGSAVVLCGIAGSIAPASERWPGVVYATSAREGIAKAHALASRVRRDCSAVFTPEREPAVTGEARLVTGIPAIETLARVRVSWPRSTDARDPDAGGTVGFPLILKVEQLPHRVSVGGVVRGIADAAQLAAATRYLSDRFRGLPLSAHEHVDHDGEFMVGMVRSPDHGVLISFGFGGSDVGAAVSFRSAPLTPADTESFVASYLAGHDEANVRAVRDLLENVAELAGSRPDIVSLDLNPVAFATDGRLVALDCKLEVMS